MATETTPRPGLMGYLEDMLEGKADGSRLAELLATTRKEMAEHRQGFEDSVSSLDPAVAEKVVPFVEVPPGAGHL